MDKKKSAHNCCEFSVVIRDLILNLFLILCPGGGIQRRLDLNSSPLTFFLGNGKRLVTLGFIHVTCFKLLKIPSH